jgi:hypothetical protein
MHKTTNFRARNTVLPAKLLKFSTPPPPPDKCLHKLSLLLHSTGSSDHDLTGPVAHALRLIATFVNRTSASAVFSSY